MIRSAAAVCAVVLGILTGAAPLEAADPPPKAAPPKPVDPKAVPPDLADWTPRPALGKAEPWERATDKDWVDARFREMNTGPFLNATFRYPNGKGNETVYKGTAIRLGEKGDAGVLFDRNTLRLAAGWVGGYLTHGDRRFGLLNTPTPKGDIVFASAPAPGWADPDGKGDVRQQKLTAPLPAAWGHYRGMYIHGNRVVLEYTVGATEVLETPTVETIAGIPSIVRTIRISPTEKMETLAAGRLPQQVQSTFHFRDVQLADVSLGDKGFAVVAAKVWKIMANLHDAGAGEIRLTFIPFAAERIARLIYANNKELDHAKYRDALEKLPRAEDLKLLTKPGPARWGQPLVTDLVRSDDSGPFAVDTLTLPYDNPFKALFFCTGIDHLPDGRVAVCTCHGDVWLARIDESARKVHWQRFATGLYHPLGLKVIDGKVIVLERGQLTRLHDNNADGEADFYECVNNDWHTGAGEHSYDTCLETDPAGNFYFFKTGDTDLPHGGCLMKVSKDGSRCEVFCTGFRHPIGLGLSPTGIVTGADQEGNWMPATRIDQYKPGGFYGDMRAHHRKMPPKIYDGPLCWLPREVDNSAGGQVWVPTHSKWPLAGLPIHFSYGRCKAFVLLRQDLPDGTVQGGVADLHTHFLSGVCRGRFHPTDGHLYVCGLNGWQTSARADGCVQRVRYTGQPLDVPVKMEVVADGVKLTFSRPLDRARATDPANYRAAWWNYQWSGEYGSKRYKVSGEVGQDDVTVKAAEISADGRTILVKVGPIKPVMQMQVGYNVAASDGKKVVGSVYLTVHQAR